MDLEHELRALAAEIDWPATPDIVLSLPSTVATPRRAGWRRHAVLAIAVLALAVAATLAVPGSRAAILRFLHLRGATIELVDRLPSAQERPLARDLGAAVSAGTARRVLGRAPLLPPLSPAPPLHLRGQVVSLLFLDRGSPVLLSELAAPAGVFLKKIAATGTSVTPVTVEGEAGLWLSGRPHLFIEPDAPPRLAGSVLLWQHGPLTLRLEGPALTLARAQELARSLR